MTAGNGQWGTVEPERVGEVLFEVKNWKDDAARELAEHAQRLDEVEGKHDRVERKIDQGFAWLKGAAWIVGIFWTAAVVLVGFWLAR